MKRTRFTEEQNISVLREHEAGAKSADLARKHSISEATLCNWKAMFGGMDVSDAVRRQASAGAGRRELHAEEAAGGVNAGPGSAKGASDYKW
jgi:putative transposase